MSARARKALAYALYLLGGLALVAAAILAFNSGAYTDTRVLGGGLFALGAVVFLSGVLAWPLEPRK